MKIWRKKNKSLNNTNFFRPFKNVLLFSCVSIWFHFSVLVVEFVIEFQPFQYQINFESKAYLNPRKVLFRIKLFLFVYAVYRFWACWDVSSTHRETEIQVYCSLLCTKRPTYFFFITRECFKVWLILYVYQKKKKKQTIKCCGKYNIKAWKLQPYYKKNKGWRIVYYLLHKN